MVQGAKQAGLFGESSVPAPEGGGADEQKQKPNPKPKPPKKEVGMKKKCGSKITMLGTKLTELKVTRNKVQNAPLLLGQLGDWINCK